MWEEKRLGDVLSLEYGKPLPEVDRVQDGGYPAYGANGIKCRSVKCLINKRTIIVGRKGSAGELTLSEDEFWPLDVTYYADFDRKKYDLRFLYFYLSMFDIPSLAKGVKPGINRNDVYELRGRFPELSEQKRIVAILDDAFAGIDTAIANTEKAITSAREIFESELNAVFAQNRSGWIEKRLEQVTSKIGSGATPKGGGESYKQQGTPLIRSLNVHDRRFVESKLAYIDDQQAEKLKNVIVNNGDVLFNITGASIARCCVAPDEYLPARVNQHVSIIRPQDDVLCSSFLCYMLTSLSYKQRLLGIGEEGGTTRQAITKSQLQDLKICFPSLEEQKAIIIKLDNLAAFRNTLIANYTEKLAHLQELKQSLLNQAFSGKLTANQTEA